jgi:hypothetical protein
MRDSGAGEQAGPSAAKRRRPGRTPPFAEAALAPPPLAPRGKPRQAVIVIHGIGEQRPMDTLRSFVLGVLGSELDADGKRRFYSKPDPNAEGFEERRYRAFSGTTDSDFIEFYWQHLMPIAAWRFVFSWLWLLMRRPVEDMPQRFAALWWICWVLLGTFLAALLAQIVGLLPMHALPTLSGLVLLAAGTVGLVVRSYVGDAAIYLNPHPRTVQARNDIRQAGVALLARLHGDGRYDRIVVVGHSLGSVIGYDILNFAWQRESEALRRRIEQHGPAADPDQPRLTEAEQAAAGTVTPAAWHQAVYNLHFEQRRLGARWLVTDFVTLGSPLAHARLLLARGEADFDRRVAERELPTAPPFARTGPTSPICAPAPSATALRPQRGSSTMPRCSASRPGPTSISPAHISSKGTWSAASLERCWARASTMSQSRPPCAAAGWRTPNIGRATRTWAAAPRPTA